MKTSDLAKINPHESNPNNNNKGIGSYLHYDDNNYQKAVIDAWRLLSRRKQLHPNKQLVFDQDLCIRLVKAYDLDCSGCLLPCVIHKIEAMK